MLLNYLEPSLSKSFPIPLTVLVFFSIRVLKHTLSLCFELFIASFHILKKDDVTFVSFFVSDVYTTLCVAWCLNLPRSRSEVTGVKRCSENHYTAVHTLSVLSYKLHPFTSSRKTMLLLCHFYFRCVHIFSVLRDDLIFLEAEER